MMRRRSLRVFFRLRVCLHCANISLKLERKMLKFALRQHQSLAGKKNNVETINFYVGLYSSCNITSQSKLVFGFLNDAVD